MAAIAALALVANGIVTQSRELREAASSDIQAYSDANRTSSELSGLRVTEISAVAARGSGAPLYTTFEEQAAELLAELDEAEGDSAAIAELRGRIDGYVAAVEAGADFVSTTMSGYTEDSPSQRDPDLELVAKLSRAWLLPPTPNGPPPVSATRAWSSRWAAGSSSP